MANYALPDDVSDAELLLHYRALLEKLAVTGESYTMDSRSMNRVTAADCQLMITWLEERINAAASGPAVNLTRLRRC